MLPKQVFAWATFLNVLIFLLALILRRNFMKKIFITVFLSFCTLAFLVFGCTSQPSSDLNNHKHKAGKALKDLVNKK